MVTPIFGFDPLDPIGTPCPNFSMKACFLFFMSGFFPIEGQMARYYPYLKLD